MKTYKKLEKSSSLMARTSAKMLDIYERQVENCNTILSIDFLYLLKSIRYIDKSNYHYIRIINSVIEHIRPLKKVTPIAYPPMTPLPFLGYLSTDSKRFRFKLSEPSFRKTIRIMPQCKEADGRLFILQDSLNILSHLYIYIFSNQIAMDDEASIRISRLLKQARNREVRKLSFYGKVRSSQLVKSNPVKKVRYYSNIPLWYHQRRAIIIGLIMPQYNFTMEQRTGKTLVNSCIAAVRHKTGQVKRVLVIGPISAFKVWEKSFTQDIDCDVIFSEFKDPKLERENFHPDYLIVRIVNFESVALRMKEIKKYSPDMVIVDEIHRISDKSSNQSKAIHKLNYVKYRYGNTGTPIEGKLEDVWSHYKFLLPDLLGSTFTKFSSRYLKLGEYRNIIGYKREKELMRKVHNTSLVLSYEECFGDDDIPHLIKYGDLSEVQREIYKSMDQDLYVEVEDSEIEAKIVLSQMIKLQQITGGFIIDNEGETIDIGSSKMDLLHSVMVKRGLMDKKTVIFARFNNEIWGIHDFLNGKRIKNLVLTGKDLEGKRRKKGDIDNMIDQFTTDPSLTHIVVQIKIAKEAIDLSVADNEIFYSNGFSYKDYDQARKRIRNANKNSTINCINLVMENTIDEVIMEAMEYKKNMTSEYFYEHHVHKKKL